MDSKVADLYGIKERLGDSTDLANIGLRTRLPMKLSSPTRTDDDDDEDCRPWHRRIRMALSLSSWGSALRIALLLSLVVAVVVACFTLPVEQVRYPFSALAFSGKLILGTVG